jgi:CRP-like cAMP-binding protein
LVGVIEGLVKVTSASREGKTVSFTGIPAGGWFGEGSLLKNEPRRYDAVALRNSVVAYMPRDTFTLLLDSSVAFNRLLLIQLNERLGQFIAMVEHDRLPGPEGRLATELAALFQLDGQPLDCVAFVEFPYHMFRSGACGVADVDLGRLLCTTAANSPNAEERGRVLLKGTGVLA